MWDVLAWAWIELWLTRRIGRFVALATSMSLSGGVLMRVGTGGRLLLQLVCLRRFEAVKEDLIDGLVWMLRWMLRQVIGGLLLPQVPSQLDEALI